MTRYVTAVGTWIIYTREELGLPVIPKGPRPRPIRCRVNDRGCHICTSHTRRQEMGYPVISLAGKDEWLGKILYERFKGPVPLTLILRHQCDEPMCINFDHLESGTYADNSRDMVERGRSSKGSRNGNSRLTEEQAAMVKASNGISAIEWARRLGVSKPTILNIWREATWHHVPGSGEHRKREGNRKLTEEQVRQIRLESGTSGVELAARYGVTPQAISLIRSGRNWKDTK